MVAWLHTSLGEKEGGEQTMRRWAACLLRQQSVAQLESLFPRNRPRALSVRRDLGLGKAM
jgi:hypothetical protein